MKDDRLYFLHVRDCINHIVEFTVDGKEAFMTDRKTHDAVLRNLHTLAESIQRISRDLKIRYPEVHWREISAFRNIIVHDYLGVDLERSGTLLNGTFRCWRRRSKRSFMSLDHERGRL